MPTADEAVEDAEQQPEGATKETPNATCEAQPTVLGALAACATAIGLGEALEASDPPGREKTKPADAKGGGGEPPNNNTGDDNPGGGSGEDACQRGVAVRPRAPPAQTRLPRAAADERHVRAELLPVRLGAAARGAGQRSHRRYVPTHFAATHLFGKRHPDFT